jgi:hypothetical protein
MAIAHLMWLWMFVVSNQFGSVGACALADALLVNHTLTELDISKFIATLVLGVR